MATEESATTAGATEPSGELRRVSPGVGGVVMQKQNIADIAPAGGIGVVVHLPVRGKEAVLHVNAGRAFDESAPIESEAGTGG